MDEIWEKNQGMVLCYSVSALNSSESLEIINKIYYSFGKKSSEILLYRRKYAAYCLRMRKRENGFFQPAEMNKVKIILIVIKKLYKTMFFSQEMQQLRKSQIVS